MRDGKGVSRSKNDEGIRNGIKDPDKGHTAVGPRGNRSSSDSDDADVMRQLLSPYVSSDAHVPKVASSY